MEIVVQIVQQLPPVWPRVTALLGLALLFFLPEVRQWLIHKVFGRHRTDRLKHLLELRKLELDVATLKAANPAAVSALDAEIEKMQRQPLDDEEQRESLSWSERAKSALAGSFSWILLSVLALTAMGHFSTVAPTKVLMMEFVVALAGGLLASAIPSTARWYCVFRGALIPALIAALSVAARGHG